MSGRGATPAPAAAARAAAAAAGLDTPFDYEKQELVIDFRSVSELPFDPDTGGVKSFRAVIFDKGKGLHVPGQPGKLVVAGCYVKQVALCRVHFKPAYNREPELLLNFVDYGFANASMSGISVETLPLPLMIRKGVFQDKPMLVRAEHIAGFSRIDSNKLPWTTSLKPCLQKQDLFNSFGVFSSADVNTWLSSQKMAARVNVLNERARAAMEKGIAALARQDKEGASKQKAVFESKLETIMSAIRALPPSAYDVSMSKRIISLMEAPDAERPDWLKSPEQRAISQGLSQFVRTKLITGGADGPPPRDTTADRQPEFNDTTETPAPAAATATREPTVPARSDEDKSEEDEEDEEDGEDEEDEEDDNGSFDPGGGSPDLVLSSDSDDEESLPLKRRRTATARFGASVPKPAAKKAGARKPAAKSEAKPEATPKSNRGKPYVRGPYKKKEKKEPSAGQVLKRQRETAQTEALKGQIAKLTDQLSMKEKEMAELRKELEMEKAGRTLAVEKSRMEGEKQGLTDASRQFQLGLQAGAQLATGKTFDLGLAGTGSPAM